MQPSTTESEPTMHPSKIAELEFLHFPVLKHPFQWMNLAHYLMSEHVQFVLSITPDWCLELEIEVCTASI